MSNNLHAQQEARRLVDAAVTLVVQDAGIDARAAMAVLRHIAFERGRALPPVCELVLTDGTVRRGALEAANEVRRAVERLVAEGVSRDSAFSLLRSRAIDVGTTTVEVAKDVLDN